MPKKFAVPLIDLKAQYLSIKDEIDAAVARVLDKGNYVMGEEVEAFEEEFARFCEARYCIGLSSCTDALYLALITCADGSTPGTRRVLTTPVSFYATTQAIMRSEDHPIFTDIGDDGNIDITKAEADWDIAIPVHLYGQPARIPLKSLRPVIEDSAQGHGLPLRGKVACFSFYPTKNLGGVGQAGALVTNDTGIAGLCRRLREYGETQRFVYEHEPWRVGGNFRLDELQAAILRVKLRYLLLWTNIRQCIAKMYRGRLSEVEDVIRIPDYDDCHTCHIFAIMTKDRDDLRAYLEKRGIQTSVRYPVPMHLQPALRYLALKKGDFPKAEAWCNEVLTLPIYPEMTDEMVDTVANAVIDWAQSHNFQPCA